MRKKEGEFGSQYYLTAKSDAIASVESDLLPVRILMYAISALLVCMGLFNCFNVTISSLEARKTEFAVMESLGMTGKQLRKMLILEGFYYSSLISFFLNNSKERSYEVDLLVGERANTIYAILLSGNCADDFAGDDLCRLYLSATMVLV